MNALTLAIFACLAIFASAKPSGIWGGYGHGHGVNVVPAGPTTLIGASGIVGPNGASGPAGSVNGHGAVGPSGEHNAPAHHGAILAAPAVYGGYGHAAAIVAPAAHAVVAPGFVGAHGYGLGYGHGVGLGYGHGVGLGLGYGHHGGHWY